MGRTMSEVKEELLKDDEFRAAFVALDDEFAIASQLIEARKKAQLTQEEVAIRMGTTQSAVARLESGRPLPSLRSLKRYAQAVNGKIEIRVV
ncbi:MAG TPA: helix-turn-helix transcriptional regulator [Geomonas sp.]|nr:helix-turn-helix transcriptional regulator [Geomonas sp.]